jgi:hypothetical protein
MHVSLRILYLHELAKSAPAAAGKSSGRLSPLRGDISDNSDISIRSANVQTDCSKHGVRELLDTVRAPVGLQRRARDQLELT